MQNFPNARNYFVDRSAYVRICLSPIIALLFMKNGLIRQTEISSNGTKTASSLRTRPRPRH